MSSPVALERRTAPRYRILQRCFVHFGEASTPEAWRCVAYSVSAIGIGVTLPINLPEGTVLTIRPWGLTSADPVQARVVRTQPVDFLWFTGCELLRRLSDA